MGFVETVGSKRLDIAKDLFGFGLGIAIFNTSLNKFFFLGRRGRRGRWGRGCYTQLRVSVGEEGDGPCAGGRGGARRRWHNKRPFLAGKR